jgi:NTP pyrophosphatase (non-canonical NTP hydrolase)
MDFIDYQKKANETALYPKLEYPWVYPAFGLSGESGEIMEKLKKVIRDNKGEIDDEKRDALKKELGDVLWYVNALATELGLSLDDIATDNIAKLNSRKERNLIKGDGDYR